MISKLVRDALTAQLSASRSGVNDRLLRLASSYGITDPYSIDFSDASTNFLFGRVEPDKIEESSVLTYPLMTIDTANATDLGMVLSATFSGVVTGMIDVHHTWPNESVLSDFASLVDLTEDALISCVKDPAHQSWGGGVNNLLLRKGGVSSQRGTVSFGGANWRQSFRLICQFELAV